VADVTHHAPSKPLTRKQKAAIELREWFVNSAYLALFLCSFAIYRALITGELGGNVYVEFGASLLTAVVVGKTVLLGGMLSLGERRPERVPLIALTLRMALVYGIFVFFVTILEHIIGGWLHGESVRNTLRTLAHLGWKEITARSLVIFLAFIPFFAFREFAHRVGRDDTFDVFFRPDEP